MAFKFLNRARMSTATTGTGSITLGSAVAGFQSFAAAGIANGDTVHYVIEDGNDWEIGLGTYTASGTVLARTTLIQSSTGSKLNLSGTAQVYCDALAQDYPTATSVSSVQVQTFTSSGTYTPTSGMLYALIIALGGGAGGRDQSGGNGGLGGDAGDEVWKLVSAADIGVSKGVTIGSGGAHAANGGDTSVGSLCLAPGGLSSTTAIGDVIGEGESGWRPSTATGFAFTARGGSSRFGKGGAEKASGSGTGNAGTGFGSGGGGSGTSNGNQGGAGKPGLVIFIEFCG